MAVVEGRLRQVVDRLGPSDRAEYSASIHWRGNAPEGIFYRIRVNGRTVCRAWFPNDGRNVVEHMAYGPLGAVVHVERGR
jgi:hypothetical protein